MSSSSDPASIIVAVAVPLVVLLFIGILLSKSIYVVQQAEGTSILRHLRIVIERFGRVQGVLDSGIHFVIPFIDSPRSFSWKRVVKSNGRMESHDTQNYRIDLRESIFSFPSQEVYTRDTILLDINSIMFFRIVDIKKAVYEVDDLNTAIANVAQTQLKEVFGNMTFTEALASQSVINAHIQRSFGERFAQWGLVVERMEVLDMLPKAGTTISNAMKRQMIAERTRRAEFIIAEVGQKAAMRLISEGTKLQKYNMGVAEQEATRKTSEGQAGAKVELARAESKSLELIASAFSADGASQTEYVISQRYMEMLQRMSVSLDKKTLYFPYETKGMSGLIGDLRGVYGYSKTEKKQPAKRAVRIFDALN
ncbi:hypothetical protein SPRG_03742 [Saprolegnia parasitica CBS 223.65]|uniref:Band 7 domain-containing protein n=1 Tax=Saprolegnia parasitica (strain CBS 223.65) TaxID=695850 RepID=A0A067CYE3_SAPPC|nr:hypothetical protein SPRG_03742 [Saprolegnia parasitica CBS 223.65]KDO31822.1 hypothetical protein SPRG_03742 [Saprolegnia parasitica CBS 223.65]|eukprot:XP_012197702.1 hypothetical protein SPRG_03742 [Saprolegnia parasitica CBS 223.65]